MKKLFTESVHALFRIHIFERILRMIVQGKYVDSFWAKLVPPHQNYPQPTYRVVKHGQLVLHGNLHDYNDWKSYWGLKEIERERLYILASLSKNVVDVGSNNGWVLMNLSTIVLANKGIVYGFEPHPDSYQRCTRNVAASQISNCRIYNVGCGAKEEEKVMVTVNESNSGQNKIIGASSDAADLSHLITVKVTTLDEQLKDVSGIGLIKIDVEGFELSVVKGAARILSEDKPVLFMEVDDQLLRSNHTYPAELLSLLKDRYGYMFMHAATGKQVTLTDDFKGCHFDVICYMEHQERYIVLDNNKAVIAA